MKLTKEKLHALIEDVMNEGLRRNPKAGPETLDYVRRVLAKKDPYQEGRGQSISQNGNEDVLASMSPDAKIVFDQDYVNAVNGDETRVNRKDITRQDVEALILSPDEYEAYKKGWYDGLETMKPENLKDTPGYPRQGHLPYGNVPNSKLPYPKRTRNPLYTLEESDDEFNVGRLQKRMKPVVAADADQMDALNKMLDSWDDGPDPCWDGISKEDLERKERIKGLIDSRQKEFVIQGINLYAALMLHDITIVDGNDDRCWFVIEGPDADEVVGCVITARLQGRFFEFDKETYDFTQRDGIKIYWKTEDQCRKQTK